MRGPWLAAARVPRPGLFAIRFLLTGDFIWYKRLGAAGGIVLSMGWLGITLGSVLTGALRNVSRGFDSILHALLVGGAVMILLAVLLPDSGRKRPATRHPALGPT